MRQLYVLLLLSASAYAQQPSLRANLGEKIKAEIEATKKKAEELIKAGTENVVVGLKTSVEKAEAAFQKIALDVEQEFRTSKEKLDEGWQQLLTHIEHLKKRTTQIKDYAHQAHVGHQFLDKAEKKLQEKDIADHPKVQEVRKSIEEAKKYASEAKETAAKAQEELAACVKKCQSMLEQHFEKTDAAIRKSAEHGEKATQKALTALTAVYEEIAK